MISDLWRLRLLFVALFLCGAVLGGAVVQLRTARVLHEVLNGPPETLEARVKLLMLDRGLSLSSDQKTRIRPILEGSAVRTREVRSRIEPDLRPLREREREAIAAELEPEQRHEYERRLKDIDAALGRGR